MAKPPDPNPNQAKLKKLGIWGAIGLAVASVGAGGVYLVVKSQKKDTDEVTEEQTEQPEQEPEQDLFDTTLTTNLTNSDFPKGNVFLIDGVSTVEFIGDRTVNPGNMQFIQEIEVKSEGFSTEYTEPSSGSINIVLKTGGGSFQYAPIECPTNTECEVTGTSYFDLKFDVSLPGGVEFSDVTQQYLGDFVAIQRENGEINLFIDMDKLEGMEEMKLGNVQYSIDKLELDITVDHQSLLQRSLRQFFL